MELTVPFVPQDSDYGCGPSSIEMLLRFWNSVIPPPEEIERRAGTTPEYGTSRRGMRQALRSFGFRVEARSGCTLEDVRYTLHSGIPAIVNYHVSSADVGHYGVLVGIEARSIILHDPWDGPSIRMALDVFLGHWYGYHRTHYTRWMLTATPTP